MLGLEDRQVRDLCTCLGAIWVRCIDLDRHNPDKDQVVEVAGWWSVVKHVIWRCKKVLMVIPGGNFRVPDYLQRFRQGVRE